MNHRGPWNFALYIFSMYLADSGGFHRAVARLCHQKDNTLVRALNKALFLIKLGRVGDLATYSTRNLLVPGCRVSVVSGFVVDCLCRLMLSLQEKDDNDTVLANTYKFRCGDYYYDYYARVFLTGLRICDGQPTFITAF